MQQENDINRADPLVNLHIIGVQKAGTTALAHFLSQHPDICVVKGKEAHIFDAPDFDDAAPNEFTTRRYAEKLGHYDNERYVCDATPITIMHPTFVRRCHAYNPDAKVLVLLRDPVDRAVSHYKMTASRGLETKTILMAFLSEFVRMKGWKKRLPKAPFQHPYRDKSYLTRGLYNIQLHELYKIFDKSQVLVVRQPELLCSHQNTLNKITRFLNLPQFTPVSEVVFASERSGTLPTETLARLLARLFYLLKRQPD